MKRDSNRSFVCTTLDRIAQIEIDSQIDDIDSAVDVVFRRAGFQGPDHPITAITRSQE